MNHLHNGTTVPTIDLDDVTPENEDARGGQEDKGEGRGRQRRGQHEAVGGNKVNLLSPLHRSN